MRVLNRYCSAYDFALVLGDIVVTFVATVAILAAMSVLAISANWEWFVLSLQGVAVTVIVVVSFYYSDLYTIDQTLSIREGFVPGCVEIRIFGIPA